MKDNKIKIQPQPQRDEQLPDWLNEFENTESGGYLKPEENLITSGRYRGTADGDADRENSWSVEEYKPKATSPASSPVSPVSPVSPASPQFESAELEEHTQLPTNNDEQPQQPQSQQPALKYWPQQSQQNGLKLGIGVRGEKVLNLENRKYQLELMLTETHDEAEKEQINEQISQVNKELILNDPQRRIAVEAEKLQQLENLQRLISDTDKKLSAIRGRGKSNMSSTTGINFLGGATQEELDLLAVKKEAEAAYNELKNSKIDELSRFDKFIYGAKQLHPIDLLPFKFLTNPHALSLTISAIDKAEKGAELSEVEQNMLRAVAMKQGAEEWQQLTQANGSWQNIGKGVINTIPFMLEFIPFGGITAGMEGGIKGAMSLGFKQGSKLLGKYALKATGVEALEAPAHSMLYDIFLQNKVNQYDLGMDHDGNIQLSKVGNMGFWGNLYNSWANTTLENATERLGNVLEELHVGGILRKTVGLPMSKLDTRLLGGRLGQILNRWSSSPQWRQFSKYTNNVRSWNKKYLKLNGVVGEVMEEEWSAVWDPVVNGTFDWSDNFSRDRQFETVMSVAISCGAIQGFQMIGNAALVTTQSNANRIAAKQDLKNIYNKGLRTILLQANQQRTVKDKLQWLGKWDGWNNVSSSDMLNACNYINHATTYDLFHGIQKGMEVDGRIQQYEDDLKFYTSPDTGMTELYQDDDGNTYTRVYPATRRTSGQYKDNIIYVKGEGSDSDFRTYQVKPASARLVEEVAPEEYIARQYEDYSAYQKDVESQSILQDAIQDAKDTNVDVNSVIDATKGFSTSDSTGQIVSIINPTDGSIDFVRIIATDGNPNTYRGDKVIYNDAAKTWDSANDPEDVVFTSDQIQQVFPEQAEEATPDGNVVVNANEQADDTQENGTDELLGGENSSDNGDSSDSNDNDPQEPTIPIDAAGNYNFTGAQPETTAQFLLSSLGGELEVREFIEQASKEAQGRLKSAQKIKISSPTSDFKNYKTELDNKKDAISSAEREIAYWQSVAGALDVAGQVDSDNVDNNDTQIPIPETVSSDNESNISQQFSEKENDNPEKNVTSAEQSEVNVKRDNNQQHKDNVGEEKESEVDLIRKIKNTLNDILNKIDVPVNVLNNKSEVQNEYALAEIELWEKGDSEGIFGWWDPKTNDISIYAPSFAGLSNDKLSEQVCKTILHEGVGHFGMRELLGEKNYNQLKDNVFKMLSDDIVSWGRDYLRIPSDKVLSDKQKRDIADEYIAILCEKVKTSELSPEEKTFWQKIIDEVKNLLKAHNFIVNNDEDIAKWIVASYENLSKNNKREEKHSGHAKIITYSSQQSELKSNFDNIVATQGVKRKEYKTSKIDIFKFIGRGIKGVQYNNNHILATDNYKILYLTQQYDNSYESTIRDKDGNIINIPLLDHNRVLSTEPIIINIGLKDLSSYIQAIKDETESNKFSKANLILKINDSYFNFNLKDFDSVINVAVARGLTNIELHKDNNLIFSNNDDFVGIIRSIFQPESDSFAYSQNFGAENSSDVESKSTLDNIDKSDFKDIENDRYSITHKINEKTGKDIYVIKFVSKFDKDNYEDVRSRSKDYGGYYSRFVRGFVFESPQSAKDFAEDIMPSTEESPVDAHSVGQKEKPIEYSWSITADKDGHVFVYGDTDTVDQDVRLEFNSFDDLQNAITNKEFDKYGNTNELTNNFTTSKSKWELASLKAKGINGYKLGQKVEYKGKEAVIFDFEDYGLHKPVLDTGLAPVIYEVVNFEDIKSILNKIKEEPQQEKKDSIIPKERYDSLKEQLKKLLLEQDYDKESTQFRRKVFFKKGFNSQIFSIGAEMALYHIDNGRLNFEDYAKAMIDDLGELVRPYLKAFYNGARDIPETIEYGYAKKMTSYDEVSKIDIAKVGKPISSSVENNVTKLQEAKVNKEEKKIAEKQKTYNEIKIGQALIGEYQSDNTNISNYNEDYEYGKTAIKLAQDDVEKFAQNIANNIGVNNVKKKLTNVNIAPSGGEISFRIPLTGEKELYIMIPFEFNDDHSILSIKGVCLNRVELKYSPLYSINHTFDYKEDLNEVLKKIRHTIEFGDRNFILKPFDESTKKDVTSQSNINNQKDKSNELPGRSSSENGRVGEKEQQETKRPIGARVAGDSDENSTTNNGRSSGVVKQSKKSVSNQNNYHIEGEQSSSQITSTQKFNNNVAAITKMREIIDSGKTATKQDMEILAKYSGWGGLGYIFNNRNLFENKQLRELLSEEEFNQAALSINSAYYTPTNIIDTLWNIATKLGVKGGNILEGSAGIGNILASIPNKINSNSNITAVEIDPITGNILKLLYPDAKVEIKGFQDVNIENNSIDLAITNVPFVTGLRVFDSAEKDLSNKFKDIHDFCIAKNVRKLKPGGLGIFITSKNTLDKSRQLRNWVTHEGNSDFIAAFRLNNKTFGGTSVTSDIIVIRKRDDRKIANNAINVSETEIVRRADINGKLIPMEYNSYYVSHPENMAGIMQFNGENGDTFRPSSIGLFPNDKDQNELLKKWVKSLKPSEDQVSEPKENQDVIEESSSVKEGGLLVNSKGQICISSRGQANPLEINDDKVKGKSKPKVLEDYNNLKKALQDVLDYQIANVDDDKLPILLKQLNKLYDQFVKDYGDLNKNRSISFLRNDVDFPSVAAIENYKETQTIDGKIKIETSKSDVFKKRIIGVKADVKPRNIKEGVIASINQYRGIDLSYIANTLNISKEEATQEILDNSLGFINPQTNNIEVSYEYLSGNVREKLDYAKSHNKDGVFDKNIKALEKVIPMDMPAHLIEFSLGSSWIDSELYEKFAQEKFGLNNRFKISCSGGYWMPSSDSNKWSINGDNDKNKSFGVESKTTNKSLLGHEIMLLAMNNSSYEFKLTTKDSYTGEKTTIKDDDATRALLLKMSELRDEFKDWARDKITQDSSLAEKIGKKYNELFNAIVPKTITDEYLPEHFENSNADISLYPHQKQAVIKGVTQPILLAHEVGSGKTFTLISTAMEMRRLGTAKKPMIVVQNATVGQFVAEAKKLYPNAKVLTVTEKDRTKAGRYEFYAKIKYNDWDIIIIPQSVFDMIPDSEERQRQFIQDKIDEKMFVLAQAESSNADSNIVRSLKKELKSLVQEYNNVGEEQPEPKKKKKAAKDIEKNKANIEAKAKAQINRKVDDVDDFDKMGIDALLIDEAHEYKHLGFSTAIKRGVKGIDPSGSKKSASLFLKTRSVFEKQGWKNVVFATGTPISNTAAEIWTFMKYLMPKEHMEQNQIYYFDDFVRNFGRISQSLEFTTNGSFKETTRFASYINIPELIRIWSSVSDTVLTKEAEAASGTKLADKLPEIEGGKAEEIFLPQTNTLVKIMAGVRAELERFEKMTGKEKKKNSWIPLVMYGIAERAAIDPRLVIEDAEDEPNSKTNNAVKEILKDLKATEKYKGTVALFSDKYRRVNSATKKEEFNLYEDIKEKLIKNGIPEKQIVIMKSDMSVTTKEKIFAQVNSGDVRVIMGSTRTLGTGVNIQEKLHLIIHMDVPIRPMDYSQRVGRILRQGNLHKLWGKTVRIIRFGVEDSLDVTGYQRLKTKAKFIDSIMNGKVLLSNAMENRTLEEEEEGLFDNAVATLSGSQYALLKSQAERELRKYQTKEKQHQLDQIYIENQLKTNANRIEYLKKDIKFMEDSLAKVKDLYKNGKINEVKVGNTICKNQDELVEAVKDNIAKDITKHRVEAKNDYSWLKKEFEYPISFDGVEIIAKAIVSRIPEHWGGGNYISAASKVELSYKCPELLGERIIQIPTMDGILGIINDFKTNVASGDFQEKRISSYKDEIVKLESDNQNMQSRRGKPFAEKEKLQKAKQLVDEYTKLMADEMAEIEKKYQGISNEAENIEDILGKVSLDEDDDEKPMLRKSSEEDDNNNISFFSGINHDYKEEIDNENSEILFRKVTDKDKLKELESCKTIKVYRAMQIVGGKLYPPMSAYINGKLREPSEFGVWEEAEENPELIKNGGFTLNKGKDDSGKTKSLSVSYNPYYHTSYSPLNDQFSSAQSRSNLIIVEGEVPESEKTSEYQVAGAKDKVGELLWHSGPISSKLAKYGKPRIVFLSRWFKPLRIVPESEIADVAMNLFDGTDIKSMPSNVVTAKLRKELENKGMEFVDTDNKGKPLFRKSTVEINIPELGPAPIYKKGESITEYVRKTKEWNNQRQEYIKAIRKSEKSSVKELSSLQALKAGIKDAKVNAESAIDMVTKYLKGLLSKPVINEASKGEINKIMTQVKESVKKDDLEPIIDNIRSVILDTTIRVAQKRHKEIRSIKTYGITMKGVREGRNIAGSTLTILNGYNDALELSDTAIEERLKTLSDIIGDETSDRSEKTQAFFENAGILRAKAFKAKVQDITDARENAKNRIKELKAYKPSSKEEKKYIKDTIHELENDIINYKQELVDAIEDENAGLIELIIGGTDAFEKNVESQIKHRREIANMVNSDLLLLPEGQLQTRKNDVKPSKFESTLKFLIPYNTFITMIRKFTVSTIGGEGRLYDYFVRGLQNASDVEWTNYRKEIELLDSVAEKMFGVKFAKLMQKLGDKDCGIQVTIRNAKKAETYPLSVATAMYIYQCSKMSDGQMKLENMGISEITVGQIVETLNALDEKYIQLADYLQKDFYVHLKKRYNKLHRKMFGIPMADVDNYVPLRLSKDQKLGGDQDYLLDIGDEKPATITGAIIERTRNRRMIDVRNTNALEIAIEHLKEMEHWYAHAELARDINYVLNNMTFQKRINNMPGGKSNYNDFKQCCKVAFGVYHDRSGMEHGFQSLGNVALRGIAVSKVAFKLYTAVKQLLSLPVFLANADEKYYEKFAYCLARPVETVQWAFKNLPSIDKRFNNRMMGNEKFDFSQENLSRWARKIVDFNTQYGMLPNAAIDIITCTIGARAMYMAKLDYYTKTGVNKGIAGNTEAHNKAILDAEICFNESQQSSEGLYKSVQQVQRNLLAVAFSVFNNANFLYMRMGIMGLRRLYRNMFVPGYRQRMLESKTQTYLDRGFDAKQASKQAKKDFKHDIVKAAFQVVMGLEVAQICWNLSTYLIASIGFGGDDKDKIKDEALNELYATLLTAPVRGTNVGPFVENFVRGAFNGNYYQSNSIITHPALQDMEMIFNKVKDWQGDWWDLSNMLLRFGISNFGADPLVIMQASEGLIDLITDGDLTKEEIMLDISRIMSMPASIQKNMILRPRPGETYKEYIDRYIKYKRFRKYGLFSLVVQHKDAQAKNKDKLTQLTRYDKNLLKENWKNAIKK